MTGPLVARRRGALVALVVLAALVVTACQGAGDEPGTADDEVATDVGVTDEPCPGAATSERGCLYLGVLSDLTGPLASLGVAATEGQRAFWGRVNERGGVAGYDVDIDTYTRDTGSDPDQHRVAYGQVERSVLALAQSLGTETTAAIASDLDADDVVAATVSWWSGWGAAGDGRDLVLSTGASSCLATAVGLEQVVAEGEPAGSVLVVGYPGREATDAARVAETWAEGRGARWLGYVETAPGEVVGDQAAVLERLVETEPDVVVLAAGPLETPELVGGAVAAGFDGRVLGLVPTWLPGVLDSPYGDALADRYLHLGPWIGGDGDSAAHEAMRTEVEGELTDGFVTGWITSYPLLAALEAAAGAGDLTRAGVRAALGGGLAVDHEGALPPASVGDGEPPVDEQPVVVSAPDPDHPSGLAAREVRTLAADAAGLLEVCASDVTR